ncbi:hypothetical protein BD311DRAFT_799793 [Dichomitus squalens]|uniref:DUF6533 domain-containing protein n=1 Tax=Dichomitus squalens TaxID=114155 RepID=A0A4Q9MCQ6_9APHY|nr:hypothetical protein BD311DRAFT_799793 [Dichomitus squalens]
MTADPQVEQKFLFIQTSQVSFMALLLYELTITFGREVDVIWRSRSSLLTLLYCFNRYPSIINSIASVALFFPMNDSLPGYFEAIQYHHAFSAFRAYALSNRTIIIGILVLVLSSGFAALTVVSSYGLLFIWQIIDAPVDDMPPPFNCFSPITFNKQISIGIMAHGGYILLLADAVMKGAYVVGELIIIALTLKRTSPILVTSQHQPPRALASTLLQNSVICFSIPLVFNLIVLVNAFAVTSENENTIRSRVMIIVGNLRDPVTAILVSRFLLDLAEYALGAHASNNTWANIVTSDVTSFLRSNAEYRYMSLQERNDLRLQSAPGHEGTLSLSTTTVDRVSGRPYGFFDRSWGLLLQGRKAASEESTGRQRPNPVLPDHTWCSLPFVDSGCKNQRRMPRAGWCAQISGRPLPSPASLLSGHLPARGHARCDCLRRAPPSYAAFRATEYSISYLGCSLHRFPAYSSASSCGTSVAAKPAKLSQADELDRAGSPSRSKLSRDPASWAPTPWPGPSHGLTCKLTFQIWQDVACADSELSIIVPSVVTTWYTCTEHNTTCE